MLRIRACARVALLGRALVLALWVTLVCIGPRASLAQGATGGEPGSLATTRTNVVVFVNVVSDSQATVGVAYDRVIPTRQVQKDLAGLLRGTGWSTARDLQVSVASVHPDRKEQFPPTTAAMITLLNAPQLRDGAPQLLPYLTAFQRYDRVEVNFVLGEINPYRGVTRFDNPSLAVELFHTQEGVYRYEALLRDHTGELPPLEAAAPPVASSTPHRPAPATPAGSPWATALIVLGVVLIGCAGLLPVLSRRTANRVAPRTVTRR